MTTVLAPSPHVRSSNTIETAMYGVIIALLPGALVGAYYFGINALRVMAISIVACLAFEAMVLKMRGMEMSPLKDGSAVLTGLLLAMNLPSNIPGWMVIVGALVAIVIGKHVYGGLGFNPFNPALVARVFLLISFPVALTSWPMKTSLLMEGNVGAAANMSLVDPLIGNMGGSLGEIGALALVLGGVYLLLKKIITWHIPVSYLATVFAMTGIYWLIDPVRYAPPTFHMVTGGLMLGAFFMATDYVTSPVTEKGMIIFGVGCGVITVFIRLFGGYPEGVSFAILLMNAATPIIDRYTRPRVFGYPTRKEARA
jgi:electron transport complex protein RnfD